MEERLQKILARAGVASRRGAEQVMAEGRVTVNGTTVREMGSKADIGRDDVRVDGVRIRVPDRPVYLVLNKPKGTVTTRHDPEGRATVMGLVPSVAGLFPVGRLDVTTEGLLILTNDGAFAERVSHPRYEVPRVYEAKVHGVPDEKTLERLRHGVRVEGDRLSADRVRVLEGGRNAWLEVTLHEGKRHEVKRLLEAVGHPVSKLRRVAFGPVTLHGLEPGQFRELAPREVKGLLEARPAPRAEGLSRPVIPRRRRPTYERPTTESPEGERPTRQRPAATRPEATRREPTRRETTRREPIRPEAMPPAASRPHASRPAAARWPARRPARRPAASPPPAAPPHAGRGDRRPNGPQPRRTSFRPRRDKRR